MLDLQDELRALADRRADEATGDFDSVVSAARARRRRRTAGWSAALAVAVVAVLGSQVISRPDVVPAGPRAPELVLDPSTVDPGERFVATLPAGGSRSVMFDMRSVQPSSGGYFLRAQAPGVTIGPASWAYVDGRPNTGLVIPVYQGPGPFDLKTPEQASPGIYRVCGGELCGLLTVR